jgi:hypothetical protein
MASAGSLIFELAADVAHLRSDMKQAASTITDSLKGIANSVNTMAALQGAQYASKFARAFADGIKQAVDQADALGKLAQRIGTTTEELSALTYAGKFAGASTETLTAGFRGLNKALLDARDPASNAATAIRAIGLDVKSLQAMDPARAFEEIAGAFSTFSDGAEKAAVAQQLFGKQGQALIPLLNGGKEGLQAAREEAERLGLIISSQTAQAMSDLNDNFTRLENVSQGAFAVIASQLTPALDTLVQTIFAATQEGNAWNATLVFIGTTVSDLILDINQLAQEIAAAWRELLGYGRAVGQFFSGEFRQALNTAKEAARASNDQLDAAIATTQKAKALQREMTSNPIDFGKRSQAWDDKPAIKYSEGLDKVAKASKNAKKEVDVFAQMLASLQDELRRTAADGDEMMLLLTDPKFGKFTQAQQDRLIAIKRQTVDLADAQKAAKKAQEDLNKVRDDADRAHIAHIEGLRQLANATLDAIDPTREYVRTITDLVEAQQAGFLSADQFASAQVLAAEKMQTAIDRMDPMKKQLDQLKDAMLGWGKKSSDTFIDFISGAGNASQSFGEMTASILRDIAKMLMYKNVIEPLFGWISGGFSGGIGSLFSGFAGQRMAGGPVQAGSVYRVNETPLGSEYFRPNVPGRVERDNGHDTPMQLSVTIYHDGTAKSDGNTADAIALSKIIATQVRSIIATEKRSGGLLAP